MSDQSKYFLHLLSMINFFVKERVLLWALVKSEKIKIQVKQNDKSLTGIKFKAFVYRQLN